MTIQLLEHVNLTVPMHDKSTSDIFYLKGLGHARDPRVDWMLHANIGPNQFHLLPSVSKPQVLPGYFVLFYDNLNELLDRLKHLQLEDTQFNFHFYRTDTQNAISSWSMQFLRQNLTHLRVKCPYGNEFHCYEAPKNYTPPGAHPGPRSIGLGMPFVVYFVPPNRISSIAKFYQTYFKASCTMDEDRVVVSCGEFQYLVFEETQEEIRPYDGHHLCIYVEDFYQAFRRIEKDGLNWNNPIFKDRCMTWEETNVQQQFRFIQLIDPDTKKIVLNLEHEVRSLDHPRCPL